jgi:hypothetical protein
VPYSICELAGLFVCQSTVTLVGVAFAVAALEIVSGVPPPVVEVPCTKPAQPAAKRTATRMNGKRIRAEN